MKVLVLVSLSVLSLAACGASKIPETSDVKALLESKIQGCKKIKIANAKKTNGYPHSTLADVHVVEYSYTLALRNPSEYKSLAGAYEKEKKTLQSFNSSIDDILTRSSAALAEKRNQEFAQLQSEGREIEKRKNEFMRQAKVVGNVSFKISQYYLEGCTESIEDVAPVSGFHGRQTLNVGLRPDSTDGWFDINDIGMTGKAMMRKTDNGWRAY
ncbi:hypothetical protein ACQYWY_09815 [Comamonas sediminis]|uniref:hypothetical protein n=1 Tax=Comamonas sediminis TaxID=1783360 RepID=UPI003D2D561B